jgi:hypothetical protein
LEKRDSNWFCLPACGKQNQYYCLLAMTSPTNNNIDLKKGMTLEFSVKSERHNTRTSVLFSGDLSADCDSKKCSSKCLKDLSSI